MILESLAGGVFGTVARMLPEVLKFFDGRDERRIELQRMDKQMALERLKGDQAIQLAHAQAENALNAGELAAIIEATKAQGAQTGVGWVDAINALVRPLLTFWWCIVLSTLAFGAKYILLLRQGVGALEAVTRLWGADEVAIVFAIISFWFVDRSLRRGGGVGAPH